MDVMLNLALNLATINTFAGKRFKFYLASQQLPPTGSKRLIFSSPDQAEAFLHRLSLCDDFWPRLLQSFSDEGACASQLSPRAQVASLMVRNRLVLIELKADAELAKSLKKRSIKTQFGEMIQFFPAAEFRPQKGASPKSFSSLRSAEQFVAKQTLSKEQCQAILESADIEYSPVASEQDLSKQIAQSLQTGELALSVTQPFTRPPEPASTPAPAAASRPVELAPAPSKTWVEIVLKDDKGVAIAGEEYWICDAEGNEHTGTTDSAGKARVDGIISGSCQVAFPKIDGSGIQQCSVGADCCTPASTASTPASQGSAGGESDAGQAQSGDAESDVGDGNGSGAQSALPPAQEEQPLCSLSQFEIKCKDFADRKFALDVISGSDQINGKPGMQVIANRRSPEKLNINFAGACTKGKECPEVKVYKAGELLETFKPGEHSIKVLPKQRDYSQESFVEFYRRFLLPEIDRCFDYETYRLQSSGCEANQKHSAEVQVFPSFKWAGKVGLGYKDISKKEDVKKTESGWGVSGEVELQIAENQWTYKAETDFSVRSLFPKIQNTLGDLFEKIEDMTSDHSKALNKSTAGSAYKTEEKSLVNFKFKPPNITLGGGIELKEVASSNEVDLEGNIALALSPLVEAELSTDIFDWLIIAAGTGVGGPAGTQFGKFLVRVKGWAKEKGATVEAIFSVKGGIEAKLEWKKSAGEPWSSTGRESEATGSLTMGLKAEVSIKKTMWKLSAKAGAELYVMGATNHKEGVGLVAKLKSSTVDGQPAVDGNLSFTGLAIYYAYYAEFGVKEADSSDKAKADARSRGGLNSKRKVNQEVSRKQEKVERLWTLIEKKTWFDDEAKKKTLSEAEL